ncbi:MAG: MtrB/PioB family outer membrane beta-barrel protein, partial [Rhodanobacteraceae bacterium]
MKTGEASLSASAIAMAVQGALALGCALPFAAHAQDEENNDDVTALICPTNYVDVGLIGISTGSPKFGEYNGMDRSGAYFLGDFDVRGGDGYAQGSGTTRWEASGTNLGTTSRNVGGGVTDQGHWNFNVDYDQLRHYTTDGSYQTPFQGNMGDNVFTLPPDFGVINTTTSSSNGVITSSNRGTQTLTANQLASFHKVDVYTERENTSFGVGYAFSPEWSVKFDY